MNVAFLNSTVIMGRNEDSEIIEHHVNEDMEKKSTRTTDPSSFLQSVTLSEKDGHSSTQSSHRLLAFSDSLISIIATVMILPIAHTKIQQDQELQKSLQQLLATKISVYLVTFLIVTVAWAAHIRLFQVIERIDDVLALLNLACMMLITFLPYTFSLMASFPENPLGILLFCGCAIVIGLIQQLHLQSSLSQCFHHDGFHQDVSFRGLLIRLLTSVTCLSLALNGLAPSYKVWNMLLPPMQKATSAGIVLYGFSQPYLLIDHIQISENQNYYKYQILKVILRVPVFCFLAGIFAFIFFPLAYILLALVIFYPYLSQTLKWCCNKALGQQEEHNETMLLYTYHPKEPLSKERVEAFSDGVYAIVATLLILDICEDNVPEPSEVKERFNNSLIEALHDFGPEYLAYFGSFVTVGLLWFVHHSLFLYITKTTRFMGLLNTFSLAFIGGLPLAYQLTHEFEEKSHNELEAIQISCVIIFFAGIFQMAIWVTALFNERETLHPYVRYRGKEHAFMFAKLSIYPCVSLSTFFLTCILSEFSTPIFHLMEIIVPFAFLALRILVRIALALLKLVFCPSKPIHNSVEEDETRLPFNDVVC
ncbi:endosomal/lysosomal proton channel TMEM175 isoform X1 [Lepisosteus oculatus]|uniref:endosomal/lysosomal proton channel TMEM175 isoform X1 n=1 Tax=Lepisosteus oculatus TaxID=7918 RepID=UPI003716FC0A